MKFSKNYLKNIFKNCHKKRIFLNISVELRRLSDFVTVTHRKDYYKRRTSRLQQFEKHVR